MPLISYKVELKPKWAKYFVLSVAGNENGNDGKNIIFPFKDTKLYVPLVLLPAKDNQKLSKLLNKEFERSVYWNEYKTKSENKNATKEYRYFHESNFVVVNWLFVLVYLNWNNYVKLFNTRKYYQKEKSKLIMSSSMEKTLMTKQLIQV